MYLAVGASSYILGHAMIAAVPAIGEAVGTAIRSGVNAKRTRDWNAAVQTKAAEAEKVLAKFESLRREWIVKGSPHDSATTAAIARFKRELSRAFDADSVFEAYNLLEQLVTKMRRRLTADRAVVKALFSAIVKRKTAKLLEDARG
jgi:hypothetical protein